MILILWLVLLTIFVGSYILYFSYLKLHASKPWALKIDPSFFPPITVLMAVHNEESNILTKLENLLETSSPKNNMEIVIVDDASTDKTLTEVSNFINNRPELKMKIIEQRDRSGKANALNKALEVISNGTIVVTDADTYWAPDILLKALPFLSDPTIGAITGRGVAKNAGVNWLTKAEDNYMSLMSLLRLGESKIYSTIRFEGCFAIFKRDAFDKFDNESGADDSGTALRIVQNKFRTIHLPEAYVEGEVPSTLKGRIRQKVRRASHLTGLWFQCSKLLIRRRLILPKKIAIPEIFISILDPIIFVALAGLTIALSSYYPIVFIALIMILLVGSLISKVRNLLVQAILDQFILFCSIFLCAIGRKNTAWGR